MQYLLYDGHGSTRQFVNSDLTVADSYSYDGYGVMLSDNSRAAANAGTSLLYCGEQFDKSLDQYYLRARYYNPSNGLFNQVDPYAGNLQDPQSLHKYLYCHANPVNGVDPSGEFGDFTLAGLMSAISIGMSILSFGFKAYRIGMGLKHLSVITDLMTRLVQTPLDPITLIQIRNHVFLLALAIIGDMAGTALSIVQDVLYEVVFAVAATALIYAASGLIKGAAAGIKIEISKFLNVRKMAEVRKLGNMGEEAVEIVARKTRIKSLTGTANYRIPDELTTLHLREVKNCSEVFYTSQIDDYLKFAQSKNLDFILDVRKGTKVSKTLLKLEEKGLVTINRSL